MAFRPGHLAENPLPPGITGALGLGGYQLLTDVAGRRRRATGVPDVPARGARPAA